MVVEDLTFELELDPGWRAIAEPVDEGTTQALQRMFTDTAPERVTVQVAANESTDVSGHALSGATIDVVLTIGGDVEGHAFSLRFPSPEDAQRMRHPPRGRRPARRRPDGRFHRRRQPVGRPAHRDRSRRPGRARRRAGPLDGQPRVEGRSALPTP